MMKRPEHFAPGAFPVFLASGQGAWVEDVDGQRYLDYIGGLGANILGHNHPTVVEAIRKTLERGLLHSLPTPIEVEAADAVQALIPGAEMIRFFKTGADATSAAVRLARHITGKQHVLTVGYNGWHDHFMVDTPGIPPAVAALTTRLPLFEVHDEDRLFDVLAARAQDCALLLVSLPYNRCVSRAFMERLREACTRHGVLFGLDEVVTGFRLALGGAQEYFGVQADLVCVSKALAGGMPLSAIAGPRAHLARLAELQVSTTFGGELLSLAACKAVLGVLANGNGIPRLAQLGRRLREGIDAQAERHGLPLRVLGYDPIPCFRFGARPDEHARHMQRFQREMAARGVLLRRDVNFLSTAHSEEEIDATIERAGDALEAMRSDAD